MIVLIIFLYYDHYDQNMKITEYFEDRDHEFHSVTNTKFRSNGEPYNCSFLTLTNLRYWLFISNTFRPKKDKRLFFLPCANANKSRGKIRKFTDKHGNTKEITDNRKFISESVTHNFIKSIREDEKNEKVILSEPLAIIPYQYENHYLRPDYNLPVDFLSVQGEFIFIDRLSQYLLKLKYSQPDRKRIFYFGGCHHYFILRFANLLSANLETGELPFEIVYKVPKGGIRGYASGATEFMEDIKNWEKTGFPDFEPLSIEKELGKRTGRYTHKPFFTALIQAKRMGKSKSRTECKKIKLAGARAFQKGFSKLYAEISCK